MRSIFGRYYEWLHGRWPVARVEPLPEVHEDGSTRVPGLFVVGDLTGVPLLKFAADGGARVVRRIATELASSPPPTGVVPLVIVGGGVSGMAAALEARSQGLDFVVVESTRRFATIADFPARKPIFTYPSDMQPEGALQVRARVKEELLTELEEQTADIEVLDARCTHVTRAASHLDVHLEGRAPLRAENVVVAIGRSGEFRRLDVPGGEAPQVHHRLHDPRAYAGADVVVVGGGDSAVEAAVALHEAGARTTLVHRGEFTRPKADNLERLRRAEAAGLRVRRGTCVKRIEDDHVELDTGERLDAATVFAMLGREAPLDFFRRSGVPIRGEWTKGKWASLVAILLVAVFVYHWKTSAGIPIYSWFQERGWFPFGLTAPEDPSSLPGTIRLSMHSPSFYYSLAYSLAVSGFGWMRIRRRKTPYVTAQTITLAAIQILPLFLLPYVVLPWLGHNGVFDQGLGRTFADALFPVTQWDVHGREYWRSVGFVLAWPLMFWNVFTDQPIVAWLVISLLQTFVVIPWMVWRWGKGAYCGWICSCGALAETVGDTLREKMPRGERANRWNMLGQVVLAAAFVLLLLRGVSWIWPELGVGRFAKSAYMAMLLGRDANWGELGGAMRFLNYTWIVDVTLAGILGVGLYAHFSGRMWCRFACPLAALMHVYARFSRFRILADAKRCISCNVCTSVCHQGIDVMGFASRGEPMADPQCVRCSACVQSCPTAVLEFGSVDPSTGREMGRDRLAASPTRLREPS